MIGGEGNLSSKWLNVLSFFLGPVFLMIGGEGNLSSKWLNFGAMVEYAAQHKALLLGLEHRFYGKSHPLGKFICWFLLPCHYVIQES